MTRPSGHLTSAEYAAHAGVAKSRVSAYVAKGMPYVDGKDDHGRDCKFIEPTLADQWRATYLGIKVDQTGRVRGAITAITPASEHGAPSEPQNASSGGAHHAARASPSSRPKRAPTPAAHPPSGGAGAGASGARDQATRRIQAAKVSEAEDRALSARFRRLKEQGRLLDRKAFMEVFEAFVGKVGVTIDRMPQDMATAVAARLETEEHPVYLALREVAERMRSDLATFAEQQRDALPVDEEPPEDGEAEASLFEDDEEF